jgi:outer membrane cobalamin receptor
LGPMKRFFVYKLITIAIILIAIAAVATRAQESMGTNPGENSEEVTNFDDIFAEESTENTAKNNAARNTAGEIANDSQIGVTVLDEMGIEGEGINESQPVDKKTKAESVKVMDATELQGSSATIADATNRSSGVKVRQSGGMGSESKINIRGMEGKNVKVLVDGVPVDNGNGSLSVNDIPIDKIDRIEVYKSYVPERFATDGMGGVINIVTHNLPKSSVTGSYSFGSFNTHKASLDAKYVWVIDSAKSRAVATGLSAYYNYSDNDYEFTTPYMDTVVTRDHDRYYSYNVAPYLSFERFYFDRITLGAGYNAMDKEIQSTAHRVEDATANAQSYGVNLSLEKANLFIKGLSMAVSASYAYGEESVIDTSHTYYYGWGRDNFRESKKAFGEISLGGASHIERKNQTFIAPWNFDYAFTPSHILTWSGLFRYESQDPKDKRMVKGQKLNNAGFPGQSKSVVTGLSLENNFWSERIQNVAGVKGYYYAIEADDDGENRIQRLTDDKADNKDFGYSENLRLKIIDQLSVVEEFAVKGGYQHSLRFPTREEIFGDGMYVQCAPNLKPEKSDNFTAGTELNLYKIPLLLKMHLEFNWFYLLMDDRIYWNSYAAVPRPYYNSVGTKTTGFEVETSADVTEYVSLNFNLTKQDAESRETDLAFGIAKGLTVPNIPTLYMNFGAEFHIGDLLFRDDFFKFYWLANYTDEYYYSWKVSNKQDRTIPSSFSQDLGVEYSILANTLSWNFEVRNFMDELVYDKYGESKPGRAFATKIKFTL